MDTTMPSVLIIEDEALIAAMLCDALERHNVRVEWESNAEAALKLYERGAFDVVVLDLGLPDTATGFALCRKLQMHSAPAQIVVFTGYADDETRRAAEEACVDDFITKPVNMDEFVLHVRTRVAINRAVALAALRTSLQEKGEARHPAFGR